MDHHTQKSGATSGSRQRVVPPPQGEVPARTRVLCVDDSPDMAEMLVRLMRAQPDLEDAGALDSAEGIVDEVVRRRADVVVLDLTMPGPPPLGAIRAIADHVPSCRVIAYSGYDDPGTREAARRAGAWELVSKHGEPGDIIAAIRRAGIEGRADGAARAPAEERLSAEQEP